MKTVIRLLTNNDKLTNALLYCGICHLLLAVVLMFLIPFEQRQLLGINLLIKPLKFALSIGIYCITWTCLLTFIPNDNLKRRFIRFTVFAMSFEMAAVLTQAARGELSHFNQSGTYNIVLYALMGIVITAQTLFSVYLGAIFFKATPIGLSTPMTWAIRFGILISVFFALQGGFIGQRMAHTVGAPDGGTGISFLNWSTSHGDLRIAHFFGLHALQLLPALVWIGKIKRGTTIIGFCLLYFSAVSFLFYHALLGKANFSNPS